MVAIFRPRKLQFFEAKLLKISPTPSNPKTYFAKLWQTFRCYLRRYSFLYTFRGTLMADPFGVT